MKPFLIGVSLLVLGLGTIEGFSRWWMHPAPAGLGAPVLVYRPGSGNRPDRPESDDSSSYQPSTSPASSTVSESQPSSVSAAPPAEDSFSDHRSLITDPFSITPLPEIYAKAAPMLRCSSGQVNHAKLSETSGIHLAFFEWDGTDTGSVLEAFRHMPEACMGSIGMILVSKEKAVPYTVDGETLLFDHTVFREPAQGGGASLGSPLIHAYRAIWVSGVNTADAREGLAGDEFDRLRTIRLKSALNRFRPAHARVIQGAVRGIPNPDLAWQAFEAAMLRDLHMALPNQ